MGDFGTSGVLSPTDLRCEGDLRDVEGRFSIGIGGLRDVGGAVAYGIWVWWCIGFFGTWRVNLPYHMDCRIAGRRGRRPLQICGLCGFSGRRGCCRLGIWGAGFCRASRAPSPTQLRFVGFVGCGVFTIIIILNSFIG